MRRTLYDVAMSAGAIAIVLVMLAAFDGRVREQVMLRIGVGHSSATVVDAGNGVRDMATGIIDVIRNETELHTTLVIFVLAATVLTVLMVRT